MQRDWRERVEDWDETVISILKNQTFCLPGVDFHWFRFSTRVRCAHGRLSLVCDGGTLSSACAAVPDASQSHRFTLTCFRMRQPCCHIMFKITPTDNRQTVHGKPYWWYFCHFPHLQPQTMSHQRDTSHCKLNWAYSFSAAVAMALE